MISCVNPECTESFQSSAGRISLAVLERLFLLGCAPSGECLEAAGQAKYLARFILAAACEISDLSQVAESCPAAAGPTGNIIRLACQQV